MTRNKEREQAFFLLFEWSFQPFKTADELIELSLESGFIKPSAFTERLLRETMENREEIDSVIERFAEGWSLSRLTKVSLSTLRLAVCEILYFDDIPEGVSINEAVNLAKKYAGPSDSAFINGVLGGIARDCEAK